MKGRLIGAIAILAAAAGCNRAEFVAEGALARPLTEFDRVDVLALVNKLPAMGEVSADPFLQSFRKDLTSRLQKKKVLNLTNGPKLILEASLLKYDCQSRPPSYHKDNLTDTATIEVAIALTDEAGKRVGGGKATIEYQSQSQQFALRGAEKRIVNAIGEYLRKSVRGKGPDVPDPDDP
jgi:hypothetical protein